MHTLDLKLWDENSLLKAEVSGKIDCLGLGSVNCCDTS